MRIKSLWHLTALLVVLALALAACQPQAAPTQEPQAPAPTEAPAMTEAPAPTEAPVEAPTEAPPAESGGLEIPEIEEGKFNIAMVLIGPHDDGGWSQAHYEGLEYIKQNVANVNTAYIENVP